MITSENLRSRAADTSDGAAAYDLRAAADFIDGAVSVVRDCQSILADYLPPDGITRDEAINRLLQILDGPRGLEVAPPIRNT